MFNTANSVEYLAKMRKKYSKSIRTKDKGKKANHCNIQSWIKKLKQPQGKGSLHLKKMVLWNKKKLLKSKRYILTTMLCLQPILLLLHHKLIIHIHITQPPCTIQITITTHFRSLIKQAPLQASYFPTQNEDLSSLPICISEEHIKTQQQNQFLSHIHLPNLQTYHEQCVRIWSSCKQHLLYTRYRHLRCLSLL